MTGTKGRKGNEMYRQVGDSVFEVFKVHLARAREMRSAAKSGATMAMLSRTTTQRLTAAGRLNGRSSSQLQFLDTILQFHSRLKCWRHCKTNYPALAQNPQPVGAPVASLTFMSTDKFGNGSKKRPYRDQIPQKSQ
jgi:hypothetical protein